MPNQTENQIDTENVTNQLENPVNTSDTPVSPGQESETNMGETNRDESREDDDNSSSTSGSESEESDMEDSFVENSTRYVVMVDDLPHYYTDDLEDARIAMRKSARNIARTYVDPSLQVYIAEHCSDKDRMRVVGKYRYFVFGYDRLLSNLSVHPVEQIRV